VAPETARDAAAPHPPGDDLVADANLVFDRAYLIAAAAEEIWPWLVQLGKRRAGWYLPAWAERFVPPPRRGARLVEERWQTLTVGEQIPDYGGRNATLEVAVLDPPRALVYRAQRGRAVFSWALILDEVAPASTLVQLRFRGRIRSSGWRYRLIAVIGGGFDRVTSELMLRGLGERVAPPS
jgi:hypothetical protein